MSTIRYDRHSICSGCRNVKCDLANRCSECVGWSNDQMEDYVKHRKSLESKSKKKADVINPPVSTAVNSSTKDQSVDEEVVKKIESRLTMTMQSMFTEFMKQVKDARDSNVSIAAPPSVPNSASVAVAAGGDDGRKAYMADRFGPSGEGQTGVIPPNPNLHGNVNVCY